MANPMRSSSQSAGHHTRVADSKTTPLDTSQPSNFEYDDNEWDIGIGDLIIDLDADIEKTTEGAATANAAMASSAPQAAKQTKMAIEHSATVDKGLKMKIKRTKPGTKTSEAKHEIVKSGELNNGNILETNDAIINKGTNINSAANASSVLTSAPNLPTNSANGNNNNKRGSSGHRRDKIREKHSSSSTNNIPNNNCNNNSDKNNIKVSSTQQQQQQQNNEIVNNGLVKVVSSGGGGSGVVSQTSNSSGASDNRSQRPLFPASTGPGPPASNSNSTSNISSSDTSSGPPQSPAAATAQGSAAKPEQAKVATSSSNVVIPISVQNNLSTSTDERSMSPPAKKCKTDVKEMADVCVGTSVGTITEPDCLGPCEPGTSVTLEGIVWHETEGGVLVVNVTWRGKTYVGTLLDCTRHDWAPPRFCDSPTSDLDNRTPKGRGKRGRSAGAATPSTDLSNFTETRSSVHSKLRNGGPKGRRATTTNNGTGTTSTTAPSSPTPFVSPRPELCNKRKIRIGEDDNNVPKKTKVVIPPIPVVLPVTPVAATSCSNSPPTSPVLLECPEPNCSKKYKHINGLKYHQSHAHGAILEDDDDIKDVASMSDNDESNIDAPSPLTVVKSPEKPPQDSPINTNKKELIVAECSENSESGGNLIDVQGTTPRSTPPSPATPQSLQDSDSLSVPLVETKNIVKPGVLRYTPPEEFITGIFSSGNKGGTTSSQSSSLSSNSSTNPSMTCKNNSTPTNNVSSVSEPPKPQSFTNQLQTATNRQFTQPSSILMTTAPQNLQPTNNNNNNPPLIQNLNNDNNNMPNLNNENIVVIEPSPQVIIPTSSSETSKLAQFRVKSATTLMSDDKKPPSSQCGNNNIKLQSFKKKDKNRKANEDNNNPNSQQSQSFAGINSMQFEQPGMPPLNDLQNNQNRDEVQSPAYSDISDDGAPCQDSNESDKVKNSDKKIENSQIMPHMQQYSMYPYYGTQYLVPPVQENKQIKEQQQENIKILEKTSCDVEKDETISNLNKKDDFQSQKVMPQQQHYYPYYMPSNYPYNIDPNYTAAAMVAANDETTKIKEERNADSPIINPIDSNNSNTAIINNVKQQTVGSNPPIIQVPNPNKVSSSNSKVCNERDNSLPPHPPSASVPKDKQTNDNHQILKESIEMKNQMNNYVYGRQNQQQQHQQQQQQQREEDARRYYVYSEQQQQQQQQQQHQQQQRRKEQNIPSSGDNKVISPPKIPTSQSPQSFKPKEIKMDEKKEKEIKQEGVKPTMETQGPPPPPTSQQYYIHPSYMQSAHYGALPFDPNHPMYRGIMVPGPYSGSPYLHAQIPRYHGPEDLSRAQPGNKALDMLQHHAQYYSSHKIHELQERAIKSPTPKASQASSSPITSNNNSNNMSSSGQNQPINTPVNASQNVSSSGKQITGDNKDSRSPPPQRHVHTHHHTHVGLGYPMYPAPYGAAVLASQQAAAVTVINPYPTK